MATGDLILATDGELAIKIGRWAKDKLFYIQRICHIFNTGMKDIWQTRVYIDLLAGPGICVVDEKEEILGSPLLALSCETPFTHYYFNDLNKDLIKALQSRVSFCKFAKVEYFSKDCNSVIDDLLTKLPDNSLDLCFIDLLNWEIHFNSIQKLTSQRRMDLAITFHIGNIKRAAGNPPKELSDFFPYKDWYEKYAKARISGKSTGRTLLDAYEEGLYNLGYKEIRDYVLERNDNNVPLYHLIFASKHPRGADFWDKITSRSVAGQLRMQI